MWEREDSEVESSGWKEDSIVGWWEYVERVVLMVVDNV